MGAIKHANRVIMKNKFAYLAAIALLATSCGNKQQDAEEAEQASLKYLVIYYSQTGATEKIAQKLHEELGADIELIEPEKPYSGTYDETIERCLNERKENIVPKIQPLQANIDAYDIIFIGYPVWFGTYARPIEGLVQSYDFEGKRIIPFCTFGSGGLESSTADLQAALPKAEIEEGYGVRNARIAAMPAELDRFLKEKGLVDGDVEALPAFSQEQLVTDAEAAIFDKACSNYKFPLGTPTAVSQRATPAGTEYKFTAKSQSAEGETVTATIYVIANDSVAEFTKVVR